MILIPVKRSLAALAVLAACGGASASDLPRVVVTTTILGDLVTAVAGPDATVEVLIPEGADPHDFSPSARQLAAVTTADLVVTNGLGLEQGLDDALDGAGTRTLEIAPLLDPIPFRAGETGSLDPHVWLDPVRMADAAREVGSALESLDPGGGYRERADRYADSLLATHDEIVAILATVPAERRLLVTNHEALGYFADRYSFRIIGVIIPGGSTLADPSSEELAALVAAIRGSEVRAIFTETTQAAGLAEAIAAEAGAAVAVVELHTESLGAPGSPAGTLPGMLVDNARRIAAALAG